MAAEEYKSLVETITKTLGEQLGGIKRHVRGEPLLYPLQ